MPKRGRKKTNPAWKKLRQQHRKGPKMIKIPDPRQKKGINPLLIPGNVKMIQILYSECGDKELPISVVVFNRAFDQMGLRPSMDISMRRDQLKRSGIALRKTFTLFSQNDRVMGASREMRLDGIVGRCLVFTKPFDKSDAVVRILPTTDEASTAISTKVHVEALFSTRFWPRSVNTDVEYM